jgi:hypothetical protein
MDVKMDEKDKVVTLLCSLPKSWDHLVTSISFNTTDTLDYDFLWEHYCLRRCRGNLV